MIRVIVTTDPSECFDNPNGSISLAVSGGVPPYSYLWDGGQTLSAIYSLSGGLYSVTITDSNLCEITKEINLFTPQEIIVNPTITHTTAGQNQGSITLNVSGGAGGFTYEWSNGSNEASITGLGAGIYTVTITDANECQVYYQYTIGIVSVSELLAEESRLVVYPIPSSDVVFVDFIGSWPEKVKVELLNLEGQRLMNAEAEVVSPNGKTKISTALLKPGVYILKVYTKDGYVTQKIIKS
ncbi:MAG: T9SS type A sorting domain-containing protein [Bacteroidales bacterium]|nr:T9SS type A sorting domain-containing protein [Bacteroidales bacterium]